MELLKEYWSIIAFFLTWLATLTLYFFRQHFKAAANEKGIQSLQEWLTTFQKINTDKLNKLEEDLKDTKDNGLLKAELVHKEIENKMLKDKAQHDSDLKEITNKLEYFSRTLVKVTTTNEHLVASLSKIADRQTKQDELNLELYRNNTRGGTR